MAGYTPHRRASQARAGSPFGFKTRQVRSEWFCRFQGRGRHACVCRACTPTSFTTYHTRTPHHATRTRTRISAHVPHAHAHAHTTPHTPRHATRHAAGHPISPWHNIPLVSSPGGGYYYVCEVPKGETAKMEVSTVGQCVGEARDLGGRRVCV